MSLLCYYYLVTSDYFAYKKANSIIAIIVQSSVQDYMLKSVQGIKHLLHSHYRVFRSFRQFVQQVISRLGYKKNETNIPAEEGFRCERTILVCFCNCPRVIPIMGGHCRCCFLA